MFRKIFYKIYHEYILREVYCYLDSDSSLNSREENQKLQSFFTRHLEYLYEFGYISSYKCEKLSWDLIGKKRNPGVERWSNSPVDGGPFYEKE